MTILVTGASGFVGSAVAAHLRGLSVPMIAHARSLRPGIDWAHPLELPIAPNEPMLREVQAVIHCAAAIPARSDAFLRDNQSATAMLAGCLEHLPRLKRIVHLSSVSVYKSPPFGRWVISEEADTIDPDDPKGDAYARSKRGAELALDGLAARRSDIAVTHLRASSIYGPGMVSKTLLPQMVARARADEPLRLFGRRGYTQNFIHVRDIASLAATLALAETGPAIVNAFSDDTLMVPALAALILERLNSRSSVLDETVPTEGPDPVFVNARAKAVHPHFLALADHLLDAA